MMKRTSHSLQFSTKCFATAAVVIFMATALSGCGIKPDNVEPPQGKAADTFPRTYPAPDYPSTTK